MRRFTSWYGAHPLHLVAILASFALAGYAAVRFVPDNPDGIALWFVGAAVSHDLLLFPLYAVAGVALVSGWRRGTALPVVPWVDYVRVPALLSGLLLLVWFPLIFQLPAGYSNTTALSTEHYLEHWLAITAALFLLSAILFAVRLRREHARLTRATDVRPAADGEAARWLLRSDVDWWDLVRYGPPGFDVYVRVALPQDSDAGVDSIRAALATLASHTTTPAHAYAAIWEGWGAGAPAPRAPRVDIPHRAMLLFSGPVDALRDAPALAWYGSAEDVGQEPHLVWPADRAWCLACEVDEEIEFTVGCSVAAAEALAGALPGAVRRVQYGDPAPMYRDP